MKFSELQSLNLSGYECYLREPNKKGSFTYYLKKEMKGPKRYAAIKSLFDNIEFQCLHNLTDTKI